MLDFVNYAHLSKNTDQIMYWSTHYQLRGVASTLRQLWTADTINYINNLTSGAFWATGRSKAINSKNATIHVPLTPPN